MMYSVTLNALVKRKSLHSIVTRSRLLIVTNKIYKQISSVRGSSVLTVNPQSRHCMTLATPRVVPVWRANAFI